MLAQSAGLPGLLLASLSLYLAGCAGATPRPVTPVVEAPLAIAAAALPVSVPAAAPQVRADAPPTYIVRKGDTLWDLSGKFLDRPWQWPRLWKANPAIRNPDLIYPGDVLTLVGRGADMHLTVTGGPRIASHGAGFETVRLSPHVREQALDLQPAAIPIQSVGPFLSRPLVVGPDELAHAAYIMAADDGRLIFGAGDRVYVRGLGQVSPGARFSVFRPGARFTDPKTGQVLGYEAVEVGSARVERNGDPTTVVFTETYREIVTGDRLMAAVEEGDYTFFPSPAPVGVKGRVLALSDSISQSGTYQVVALAMGTADGVGKGNVLTLAEAGARITDSRASVAGESVRLPDEPIGRAMVFRVFDHVSYALIMNASRPVRSGDWAVSPTDQTSS